MPRLRYFHSWVMYPGLREFPVKFQPLSQISPLIRLML